MYFVEVREIPSETYKPKREKGYLKAKLNKFMGMHVKYAKVVFTVYDYIGPVSCYNSYRSAVKRYVFPIDVKMRNGEIYLIRRDI